MTTPTQAQLQAVIREHKAAADHADSYVNLNGCLNVQFVSLTDPVVNVLDSVTHRNLGTFPSAAAAEAAIVSAVLVVSKESKPVDENQAKWDAVYQTEAAKAMRGYRIAARNIEKLISAMAAGEQNEKQIYRAFDGLFSRANKAEIRGYAPASEEADATERRLRARLATAREEGILARRRGNDAEIARLKDKERAERAAMDPALRAYQDELKLTFRR